jgi:hypothetical protein
MLTKCKYRNRLRQIHVYLNRKKDSQRDTDVSKRGERYTARNRRE